MMARYRGMSFRGPVYIRRLWTVPIALGIFPCLIALVLIEPHPIPFDNIILFCSCGGVVRNGPYLKKGPSTPYVVAYASPLPPLSASLTGRHISVHLYIVWIV